MTTSISQALWPDADDEQDSLFGTPPAPSEWTPPAAALLRDVTLADLFRLKAEYKIRVGHQTGDYDKSVFLLTPDGGWLAGEKSNAEQRADARERAISNAPHIAQTKRLLEESAEFLTRIDAEINAREAELTDQKRALERLEWDIRAREAQLRRDELDHARAVFTAAHPESH